MYMFLQSVVVICPYAQSENYGSTFSFDPRLCITNPDCVGKPIEAATHKVKKGCFHYWHSLR